MANPGFLSKRVKKKPQTGITSDRYEFLGLDQAEPDLGDPLVGPSSVGANPAPLTGVQYVLVAYQNQVGKRYWTAAANIIGSGLIPGSFTVFDNNVQVGLANSFNRFNFVGANVSVDPVGAAATQQTGIATVRIVAKELIGPGNIYSIPYKSTSGLLDGANNFSYVDGNVCIGTTIPTGTASQPLQVTGDAYVSGSVGIGTTNPTKSLHILSSNPEVILTERTDNRNSLIEYKNSVGSMYAGLSTNAIGWGVDSDNSLSINPHLLVLRSGGEVLIGGSTTATGTTNQKLQVSGGAYVSGSVGIGTTNPSEKLEVVGTSNIANRTSYRSAPGDLFSFPGTENEIQFPGSSYEIVTVGLTSDVAGSLNNTYFTIYGPGGTASAIGVTAAEQNVVVWFNVAGAGSTPAVVGAGRSVGIAITSGASAISIGNSIVQQMSTDAGFTVATSGDGTVVFVAKTPQTFSDPNAGTSGFAVTTTQNGSGILDGSDRYRGGVLAPNGKIYGIPHNSTSVLVIDPVVGTATTFGSFNTGAKWFGGVLAPNGKIYGIPFDSAGVLVIDPATNTTSTFGTLGGSSKWSGGVLAPNGKIYGIPRNSESVLVIDPVVGTATTFGNTGITSDKWTGGVLAPNGKIYGIPRSSESVLVIDPVVGTATTFGNLGTQTNKFFGGVLAPNGKIYGIPLSSTSVLVVDPVVGTATTFGSFSVVSKWAGGVLAPNGKIYGIPLSSTSVLVIDPATNTTSTFGTLGGINKWTGGVLAPNGKIYGIPRNSSSVLSIGGGTAAIPDWYLSAYQNKF